MKVIIFNANTSINLDFDKDTGKKFIEAVKNCLANPNKIPYIEYSDKTDDIVFTAEYLQNSLIKIPKTN